MEIKRHAMQSRGSRVRNLCFCYCFLHKTIELQRQSIQQFLLTRKNFAVSFLISYALYFIELEKINKQSGLSPGIGERFLVWSSPIFFLYVTKTNPFFSLKNYFLSTSKRRFSKILRSLSARFKVNLILYNFFVDE